MKIIKLIIGFFTGGGAQGIAAEIRQARKDQLDAGNDSDKLAADERMNQLAVQAAAQTQGGATWLPKAMRGLFALPFVLYEFKLIVWDKMAGLGATDDLSPELWRIFAIVVTFYFLDNTVTRFTRR